jgi:hypothetical protein
MLGEYPTEGAAEMNAYNVLVAARALIDTPDKWIKGDMKDDEGRYCLVGAINEIDPIGVGGVAAKSVLAKYTGGPPATFNEALRTTHADVLHVLDSAIEKTR